MQKQNNKQIHHSENKLKNVDDDSLIGWYSGVRKPVTADMLGPPMEMNRRLKDKIDELSEHIKNFNKASRKYSKRMDIYTLVLIIVGLITIIINLLFLWR